MPVADSKEYYERRIEVLEEDLRKAADRLEQERKFESKFKRFVEWAVGDYHFVAYLFVVFCCFWMLYALGAAIVPSSATCEYYLDSANYGGTKICRKIDWGIDECSGRLAGPCKKPPCKGVVDELLHGIEKLEKRCKEKGHGD